MTEQTQTPNPVYSPARISKNGVARGVVISSAAFFTPFANAAIDITPITTLLVEAVTAATAIGIGFLGFMVGMAVYRKLRGAA